MPSTFASVDSEPTSFDAIGVPWKIGIGGAELAASAFGGPLAGPHETAVLNRIAQFDRDWSRFRDDSLVAQIARSAGNYRLPDDAEPLLAVYERLYAVTDGRLSPLVGASLEQLGYDAHYRLNPAGEALAAPVWSDALTLRRTPTGLEFDTVTPVVLDVGAAGKGYLVDLVSDLLVAQGATESLVDASGDLRVRGERSIRVALENPFDSRKALGVVELRDAALCASATTRRTWGAGLHHILDAVTGRPVDTVIASWVTASTALEADALATALFLAEPARLEAEFAFEWVRLTADGRLESSAGFDGELFT